MAALFGYQRAERELIKNGMMRVKWHMYYNLCVIFDQHFILLNIWNPVIIHSNPLNEY